MKKHILAVYSDANEFYKDARRGGLVIYANQEIAMCLHTGNLTYLVNPTKDLDKFINPNFDEIVLNVSPEDRQSEEWHECFFEIILPMVANGTPIIEITNSYPIYAEFNEKDGITFRSGHAPYKTITCTHEWTTYTGFVESYEYCIKCDIKK